MSLKNPTSEIYFMTVPFGNDYKNVVSFKNKSTQETALKALASKHFENMNIIRKDTPLKVKGDFGDFDQINYCMYKNPELDSKWWYAFVTEVEYLAGDVALIHIQTDIWQSYQFDTTYYQSYIERAHISATEDNDNWYKYTAPEDINFPAIIESDKNVFSSLSFAPVICLDTVTAPGLHAAGDAMYRDADGVPVTRFWYGGEGSGANATGIYRFIGLTDSGSLSAVLQAFGYGEIINGHVLSDTLNNHLSDIIGYTFLPSWVISASSSNVIAVPEEDLPNNRYRHFGSNDLVTASDTVSISTTGNLASGYKPDNKKMYTGLARAFKIWTKNGTSIPLAPELLGNRNSLTLKLSMRPMGCTYKVEIENYKDYTTKFFDLQYSYNIASGLNSNTGVAQQTAINQLSNQGAVLKTHQITNGINTAMGAVNGIVGTVTQAMTGNIAGAVMTGLNTAVSTGTSVANQVVENKRDNYNQMVAMQDAYGSITKCIGNNSDRTTMTNDFCKIRLADCSPTYEQCQIIDDFLTAYGYAIQKLANPSSFIKTRKYWNFVKTNGINLKLKGSANDEAIYRGIFNAGVTIWHGLSAYGNYTNNNHQDHTDSDN